ncbi:hypothetical protein Barb6XT_00851 [Bacteroidales bacterium Barb6XT]|nr:hypothetical protein Barb6XT_00851 [Bacteroidales bacterium Barb6XT]
MPMLLSTVYRCIDLISDSVAVLPLETYRFDRDGFKERFSEHADTVKCRQAAGKAGKAGKRGKEINQQAIEWKRRKKKGNQERQLMGLFLLLHHKLPRHKLLSPLRPIQHINPCRKSRRIVFIIAVRRELQHPFPLHRAD